MDMIAKAACVSKRTIYARFPSREALLSAVLAHAVDKHLAPIVSAPRSGTFAQWLTTLLSELLEASVQLETIALERLMLWARDNDPELTRTIYDKATSAPIHFIRDILNAAVESGEIAAHDSTSAALILFEAAVIGPRRRMILGVDPHETPTSRRDHVAATVYLFLGGLRRSPA